jgi:hypothetical protein
MRAKGLPGNRVDSYREGIKAMIFIMNDRKIPSNRNIVAF